MVAFDILGPLPPTKRGNKYVLLVVDLFSRHAEPYALSADEKCAQGCAKKLADDYVTRWGCPTYLLSDRGGEFTAAAVAKDVHRLLGAKKRLTSSFHPQTNGCVERLNHTVCQMLSHVISAQQTDWDEYLLPCVYAHNNHVSRATGLAPMELHIGRYPRLPMTILGSKNEIKGWQSKKRDDLDYLQLMKERQVKAYELVAEKDRLTKEKHRANNEKLDNIVTKRPHYEPGMWVWCYDAQHTIRTGGVDKATDKKAASNRIKAKLASLWTGPFKILAVGPCRFEEKEIGAKLLYLDMPFDNKTNPRVSVLRCKRCHCPHAPDDVPEFLPWQLSSYVLHKFAALAPPFYLTADDVEIDLDVARAQPTKITAHRISRGPGGKIDVQYQTQWRGHRQPTWEAENSIQQYGDFVRKYWESSDVNQLGANNKLHREYQQFSARRAAARLSHSMFVPPGYALLAHWSHGPELRSPEMRGAHIYVRTKTEGWQLGVIHQVSRAREEAKPYNVNFFDLEQRFNMALHTDNYCADVAGPPSSWCFLVHVSSGSVRRNGT